MSSLFNRILPTAFDLESFSLVYDENFFYEKLLIKSFQWTLFIIKNFLKNFLQLLAASSFAGHTDVLHAVIVGANSGVNDTETWPWKASSYSPGIDNVRADLCPNDSGDQKLKLLGKGSLPRRQNTLICLRTASMHRGIGIRYLLNGFERSRSLVRFAEVGKAFSKVDSHENWICKSSSSKQNWNHSKPQRLLQPFADWRVWVNSC